MSSELVERLEVAAQWDSSPSQLIHEAIARLEALEADKARLREALEPFAACRTQGEMETVQTSCFDAARRALTGGNDG